MTISKWNLVMAIKLHRRWKSLGALLATLVLCIVVPIVQIGASGVGKTPDPCGDPTLISQGGSVLQGEVIAVVAGDQVLIELGEPLRVSTWSSGEDTVIRGQLVGVKAPPLSEPVGRMAQIALMKSLAGKKPSISISAFQESGTPLNIMLYVEGGHPKGEAHALLEQGLAYVVEAGPYALTGWGRCHDERAEQRARAKRIGMWR